MDIMRVRLKSLAQTALRKIKKAPKKVSIPLGVLAILLLLYLVTFSIQKPVLFAYGGDTCVKQLTFFPNTHKVVGRTDFKVHAKNEWKVGGVSIASGSLCFTPVNTPQEGDVKVVTSPFGGWLAQKAFVVQIGHPPVANIKGLSRPIPISKPLTIPLDQTDTVFKYTLSMNKKQADCHAKDKKLACDLGLLDLVQGQAYDAKLTRHFGKEKEIEIATKKLTILSATTVASSSIKVSETVYSKPKTISFAFDKKITKATPVLFRIEGDKRTKLPSEVKVTEQGVELMLAEDLPRLADYELVIDGVEAVDGSSLEQPYKLPFKTSGGPKVTGINVSRTGVAMGATAVITFDQPLSTKQDISKLVSASGGAAVAGKRGNQLLVSLAGVPKCGDFGIQITADLQSEYDIAGQSAWNFGGRMVCHTIGTIGYSQQGRPINAYYFGSGPRAVVYTGAIHGNERGTTVLMERWIQDLEANARKIPADKTIVVVPRVNPDGYATGSRTNARNVDLNRNFGTSDWRTDITDVNNRPFPGGGGGAPMSESETKAIAGLASRLRPVVILSYHSIGGVLAANQAGGSIGLASTYSQLSGYRNTTGQTGETFEYSVSGTADDWYAEQLGVASILIELSSHTSPQFERNQRAMWAMVNA
jgi:hypothetical protein